MSRRELFTGVWKRRFAGPRIALRRALSRVGTTLQSPGAARDRRRTAREGARR
jgi:hypothetical protein